jgi:hypothetical protein
MDFTDWDGVLCFIHQSEIICKLLYEKFFTREDISIIQGNWATVLRQQSLSNPCSPSPEVNVQPRRPSLLQREETPTFNPTLPLMFYTLPQPSHWRVASYPLINEMPSPPPNNNRLNGSNPTHPSSSMSPTSLTPQPSSQIPPSSQLSSPPSSTSSTTLAVPMGLPSSPSVNRMNGSESNGLISTGKIVPFECLVFPYLSSFQIPKTEARNLKR